MHLIHGKINFFRKNPKEIDTSLKSALKLYKLNKKSEFNSSMDREFSCLQLYNKKLKNPFLILFLSNYIIKDF